VREREVGWVSEEVSVAGLAGTGLAGKDGGEGAGFVAGCVGGWSGCEALEAGLDGGEVIEGVEAVGTATEFAGCLGAAEHEETEDGGFVAAEVEDGADAVLVLRDAGVADRGDEGEVFKRVEGLADLFFGEIEDRVATGALVACVDQRIERERIVLGRSDLFFDEGAEDTELDGVEMHVYKVATGGRAGCRDDNEEQLCRLTSCYF
jgi:hypothetical protein